VSTVFIAALAGCGGQTAESAPAKEPPTSDVDVKFHEPEEGTGSEETAAEAEQPAAEKAEAEKPEAAKPEAGKSAGKGDTKGDAAKKGCAGLKKDTCEITMGCAWSSKKVCVDQ
jgi:hypothetical protein